MAVIFILIPVALLIAGGFLYAFFWATKDGQFDETDSPSVRILLDNSVKKTDYNQISD